MRNMVTEIHELAAFVEECNRLVGTMPYEEYLMRRKQLNASVIELLLGKEFTPVGDKTWKLKGMHALPDKDELGQIIKIVERFKLDAPMVPNDMACIPVKMDIDPNKALSSKELDQYIMSLVGSELTISDFVNIAMLGECSRKRFWRNTFIIGGLLIVAVGGYFLFKHYKESQEADDDVIDIPPTYKDDEDYDESDYELDLDLDTAPLVQILPIPEV